MASVEEVVDRFGHASVERQVEARELVELIDWARDHDVRRLIINGSFVTDKRRPNDVDVVLLPASTDSGQDATMEFESSEWPFLQILVAADEADLERWAIGDFGTDRRGHPKGVVEVIL